MPRPTTRLDPKICAEALSVCGCFNVRGAARLLTRHYDAALEPSGLRATQFVTLVAICASEPISLVALARELTLERSAVTRTLAPLRERGLVKVKTSVPGRGGTVTLTAKGHQWLAKAVPLWEKAQTELVDEVGTRQWNGMLRALRRAGRAASGDAAD